MHKLPSLYYSVTFFEWFRINIIHLHLLDGSDNRDESDAPKNILFCIPHRWMVSKFNFYSSGNVAGNARKEAEKELGKSVISRNNYLLSDGKTDDAEGLPEE